MNIEEYILFSVKKDMMNKQSFHEMKQNYLYEF